MAYRGIWIECLQFAETRSDYRVWIGDTAVAGLALSHQESGERELWNIYDTLRGGEPVKRDLDRVGAISALQDLARQHPNWDWVGT